jgi:hypothetical protein
MSNQCSRQYSKKKRIERKLGKPEKSRYESKQTLIKGNGLNLLGRKQWQKDWVLENLDAYNFPYVHLKHEDIERLKIRW